MKEVFRNKKFRKEISVTYKDGYGNKQKWVKNQEQFLDEITVIINEYVHQKIILTIRQLYYQLVARDIIPNADEIYKRTCSFATKARYAGLIDWDAIEDRGRVPRKPSDWGNIKDLIETALHSYRLPRWKDQEYYIELYCEKQAMEKILEPIARRYHIYFGVNRGYSSASTMYELAKRIDKKITDENKKAVLLYLGDHDPSGLDMVRDIRARTCEFLRLIEDNDYFSVIPLALNQEQVEQYNPPPNPAKITDPRAKWYLAEYGNKSWELDALEPKVLMDITEKGILEFLDEGKYQQWIARENNESKALREFGDNLKL